MTHIKSPTWTRPDAEPWWLPNPLAGPAHHYCPTCGGNVHDRENGRDVIRACPVCEEA